ncbi:D-arabinitol dehydrogenase 1 isoform X2 [Cephus cinctus]|uniref:D-arabinitol dehydrogenase 1 isoform X2 n=1 Tax=Cephus cinctus TaxID=211228 RepID=A0AAJ7BVJ6_CEPCN|nr:D-arabinitol dehydrogenase 1 isoform X2 [Cephus cinctus]
MRMRVTVSELKSQVQLSFSPFMMMEHLSFDPRDKSLVLKKSPIPKPTGCEVLVKVAYAGICGTDLHILEGTFPCKSDGPFTLGHEFAGTVEAIGPEVTTFKVGQRVVIDPNNGCNICNFCHNGNYHFCQRGGIHNTIGIFRNGGWSTHTIVPESQVFLVPDAVKLPQAALTEPLSCLAHGWNKINPVHVGSRVLVLGAGIIGLLWVSVLHLHGLRKSVTVSEPQPTRREIVKRLELDYEVKAPAELKGREYDLAIDCSGSGPAMESAVPLLGRGGRLCVFGVASPQAKLTLEPFQIYMKELAIVGVNINPYTFLKGISLVEAMSDSYLQYEKLGIKVFKLSQFKLALEALQKGDISKAVFEL